MIEAIIRVGKEGAYYPTMVEVLPSVGDFVELTSHTDMKDKLEGFHCLKVTKVLHKLIEFDEKFTSVIKEHHHEIEIVCIKV